MSLSQLAHFFPLVAFVLILSLILCQDLFLLKTLSKQRCLSFPPSHNTWGTLQFPGTNHPVWIMEQIIHIFQISLDLDSFPHWVKIKKKSASWRQYHKSRCPCLNFTLFPFSDRIQALWIKKTYTAHFLRKQNIFRFVF